MAKSVAPTELSGSLVLIRGKSEFEVLMLKRNSKMTFGSMHTFPGGKVEPLDHVLSEQHSNAINQSHSRYYNQALQPWYGSALIASLRETLEETGLLFSPHTFEQSLDSFKHVQPLVRLVSPIHLKRRFDTQFFVAQADGEPHLINKTNPLQPKDLDTLQLTSESEQHSWGSPAGFIEKATEGIVLIPPPTLHILFLLRKFKDPQHLFDWLAQRQGNSYEQISLSYPNIFHGINTKVDNQPYTTYPDDGFDAHHQSQIETSTYLKRELAHYATQPRPENAQLRFQVVYHYGKLQRFEVQASPSVRNSPLGALEGVLLDVLRRPRL